MTDYIDKNMKAVHGAELIVSIGHLRIYRSKHSTFIVKVNNDGTATEYTFHRTIRGAAAAKGKS